MIFGAAAFDLLVDARVVPRQIQMEQPNVSLNDAGKSVRVVSGPVFLVLAAQYESLGLPFAIVLGTPLAVLGAVLALALRDLPLDIFGQIGLLLLVGLAAKNSILLVYFA